jgi:ribosomal protein S18 acetylase RimI-like enzyme
LGATHSDVYESVNQIADVWVPIVRNYGSGDILDSDGVSTRWTDGKFLFYNTITFTEMSDREQLGRRLAGSARYMRSKQHPGFIWLFEDLLSDAARSDLPEAIAKAGLSSTMPVAGMAADLPDMNLARELPEELSFIRVRTADQLRTYADVNSLAYGWPLENCRDGFGKPDLWGDAYTYLGIVEGVPVSAAAAIPVNGRLYVANVATLPEHQGRGYGTAMVLKALGEGSRATGIRRSVLHATEAGRPVYEQIGYYKTATINFLALGR